MRDEIHHPCEIKALTNRIGPSIGYYDAKKCHQVSILVKVSSKLYRVGGITQWTPFVKNLAHNDGNCLQIGGATMGMTLPAN